MSYSLSMPIMLMAGLSCMALGACAEVSVTSIRQPGAPLDPSLRNEAEHAVDLAADWLAARQNENGSWGSETDRVERTSVALLALTARAARHSDACARAAVWLDAHTPAAREPSGAHAWRIIALLSAAPDARANTGLVQRLFQESSAHVQPADAPFFKRCLWDDARALAGIARAPAPDASALQALASLARQSDRLAAGPPSGRWLDARLINRAANGILERDGTPLDWRRDIAQTLINSQRRDPKGGGYWEMAEEDARIWQTAFGILAFQEL